MKSLACLSDRHEYCTFSFAGGAGCQCNCQPWQSTIEANLVYY